MKSFVNKRKKERTTSKLLQSYIGKCREYYDDIANTSQHAPNPPTRVQSLPDCIKGYRELNMFARVAPISNAANSMLRDSEKDFGSSSACLFYCNQSWHKETTNTHTTSLWGNLKPVTDLKTSVKLQYYRPKEFLKLSNAKMTELN